MLGIVLDRPGPRRAAFYNNAIGWEYRFCQAGESFDLPLTPVEGSPSHRVTEFETDGSRDRLPLERADNKSLDLLRFHRDSDLQLLC